MNKNKLEIKRSESGAICVRLNGTIINGVRDIFYSCPHDDCPVLNLELLATNVEIDSEIQ